MEWLLEVSEDGRQSHLDRLRQGSVRISGPALVEALEKVEEISSLGVTDIDLSQFPPSRIKALAQYVSRSKAYAIRRMPERRRIAVLLYLDYIMSQKPPYPASLRNIGSL